MNWLLLAIIIGGVAGWLASSLMGSSNGVLLNIVLGIAGGVVGSWLLGLLNIFPRENLIGVLLTSLVGAVAIIAVSRLFAGNDSGGGT